jgi:uncharacterized membrane protein YczE
MTRTAMTRAVGRLLAGLFLIAAGTVLSLRAHLGLDPWDVVHDWLNRHLPVSFGQAVLLVSLATLLLTRLAGQRPGPGTVTNMLLVSPITDLLLRTGIGADTRVRLARRVGSVRVAGPLRARPALRQC